jgi:naphthoate synthase/2-ketocyclohexanecarboxyl-CoA hydrolase
MAWSSWERAANVGNKDVIYEKKYRDRGGGVARVSFQNRAGVPIPTYTGDIAREFIACMQDASVDDTIGVAVVTSTGEHFGAGGDVQWESEGGLASGQGEALARMDGAVKFCRHPVIAAVRGYAIGASHHLAYHCDFTIAADDGIFGQNGPRVGVPQSGFHMTQLAHVVGLKRAREIWMLCRRYTAQEALQMGLINRVVPGHRLEDEVDQWCDELLDIPPTIITLMKQSWEGVGTYLHGDDNRLAAFALGNWYASDEYQEMVKAFFERRTPNPWALRQRAAEKS